MGLVHHAINEYQFRLDVQRFLWPAYYIMLYYIIYADPLSYILGCNIIYAGPLSCILGCNVILVILYYLRGSFKLHLGV